MIAARSQEGDSSTESDDRDDSRVIVARSQVIVARSQ